MGLWDKASIDSRCGLVCGPTDLVFYREALYYLVTLASVSLQKDGPDTPLIAAGIAAMIKLQGVKCITCRDEIDALATAARPLRNRLTQVFVSGVKKNAPVAGALPLPANTPPCNVICGPLEQAAWQGRGATILDLYTAAVDQGQASVVERAQTLSTVMSANDTSCVDCTTEVSAIAVAVMGQAPFVSGTLRAGVGQVSDQNAGDNGAGDTGSGGDDGAGTQDVGEQGKSGGGMGLLVIGALAYLLMRKK